MKKKSFLHFIPKIILILNSHIALGYSESDFLESKDLEKAYLEQNYELILNRLESTPLSNKEQHLLGRTYYQLHRYQEAIESLSALPQEDSVLLDLALSYFELKDYREAQSRFESLKSSKNSFIQTTASLYLAKIAIREQKWDAATRYLQLKESEIPLPSLQLEKEYLLAEIEFHKGNFLNVLKQLNHEWPVNPPISIITEKSLSLFVQAALKLAEKGDLTFLKKCEAYISLLPPIEIAQFYSTKSLQEQDAETLMKGRDVLKKLALESDRLYEAYLLLGDHAFKEGLKKKEAISFKQAFDYYSLAEPYTNEVCIKQIQALLQEGSKESLKQAKNYIAYLAKTEKSLSLLFDLERELKETPSHFTLEKIDNFHKLAMDGSYRDLQSYIVAILYYKTENYNKAADIFLEVDNGSFYKDQALYWAARALEKSGADQKKIQPLYFELYQNYPQSAYAADAFYHTYSEQEYLLGDKDSIKHLRSFVETYTDSPLLLKAYFLLGLDALRDRRSPSGKLVSRENLSEAIDAFQKVESLYDTFLKEHRLTLSELPQWHLLKAHAMLERAKANKEIAEKASAAKKEIFAAYAVEVFKQWLEQYTKEQRFHPLEEEAHFLFAELLFQNRQYEQAEALLHQLIGKYNELGITTSYFLAKSFALESHIAKIKNQNLLALAKINQAIEPHRAKLFDIDEYLTLLIDKALIFKDLNRIEEGMTQLSEVINYQAISSLRLKAMLLRAEFYATQGKRILAKKQLESLALKGGEWAQKAKEILDKEYKYE